MRQAVLALWMLLAVGIVVAGERARRTVTFQDRFAAQKALEQVYWTHRIWPAENPGTKPSLSAVMSDDSIRAKVEDYLKKSNALEALWRRPITGEQLQAELDRMGRDSRDPKLLEALFDALGNDSELIAETLARQTLSERLIRAWYTGDHPHGEFDTWWRVQASKTSAELHVMPRNWSLPVLPEATCVADTWTPTHAEMPDGRHQALAVWTGAEMIVWGGIVSAVEYGIRTGGRYNPATDTWVATPLTPTTPEWGFGMTAIWTGTEMIVWGGTKRGSASDVLNTGARYNPQSGTWSPTSTGPNVPTPRTSHVAVWTGSQMVVWGGAGSSGQTNTGGRYDPVSDTWLPTSIDPNTPSPRGDAKAIWTGLEMIVWGGLQSAWRNDGGRYDPSTNAWAPISTGPGDPPPWSEYLVAWNGTEMFVWNPGTYAGGRYDPTTDSWRAIPIGTGFPAGGMPGSSLVCVGSKLIVWGPAGFAFDSGIEVWTPLAPGPLQATTAHAVVSTGTEMIVWGGGSGSSLPPRAVGARYDPQTDTWVSTSTGTAPIPRQAHTSVWTGAEMIVWGGSTNYETFSGPTTNTGGRYVPAIDSWAPTSLGSGVPSARQRHSAVWTGREMIVLGGVDNWSYPVSGGRYDPLADAWLPISTVANVPTPVVDSTAVWTGTEMFFFGMSAATSGRYDPVTNSWRTVSSTGAPSTQTRPKSVFTGTEAIVWTGPGGARYNPVTDQWTAMPPSHSPCSMCSIVWTGSETIVWGGSGPGGGANSGDRYNPLTDAWTPTPTGPNVPEPHAAPIAVWTGSDMIVWTGTGHFGPANGGRFNPASDTWSPMAAGLYAPQSQSGTAIFTGSQMIVWGGGPMTTGTGGLYCACPDGALFYRDADGDGFGDAGLSAPSCDGVALAGYVSGPSDCNDAAVVAHPGAGEICDGIDDDCDGLVDEGVSGEDSDADAIHDLCDNCPDTINPSQSDFDGDGEGDVCDVNDGLIYLLATGDKHRIEWQPESGFTSWNSYRGSLTVLRATGQYTQLPGSNPLAGRDCDLSDPWVFDDLVPGPGEVAFNVVTGVAGGIESGLGANSAGVPRANANPCP